MAKSLVRLRALIIKELLAVTRDRRSRFILIVPPVIQLILFSFSATFEVKRIDVLVLNHDEGQWSRELIRRIEGSPSFRSVTYASSAHALDEAVMMQRIQAAIQIGPTFSRDIEGGVPASVQVILDGRKSNSSQIVAGYLTQIVQDMASETPSRRQNSQAPPAIDVRNWFNPNLEDKWHMVPSLVAVIALLTGIMVTALSVAREREMGTFDQLMVSPLRVHEIIVGKIVPPILICLVHITVFTLAAVFVFGVPLWGSIPFLYVAAWFFLFAVVGIGLFISSASATQQQAALGAFVFMVPAMVLSGFVTPIENMPSWLQPVTLANPVRYFLVVIKGVFLKAMPPGEIIANVVPLFFIGLSTMSLAAWLFRRRME